MILARLFPLAGAIATLGAGGCTLAAPSDTLLMGESSPCPSETKRCAGTCVSTSSPAVGCGAPSCSPCDIPHASARCLAGACSVDACLQGWADCDQVPSNGCESVIVGGKPCFCHAIELQDPKSRVDIDVSTELGDSDAGTPGSLALGSGPWTVEVWVKPETQSDIGELHTAVFAMKTEGDPDPTSKIEIRFITDLTPECSLGIAASPGDNLARGVDRLLAKEWNHVACVRDGPSLFLFVNGVSPRPTPSFAEIEPCA